VCGAERAEGDASASEGVEGERADVTDATGWMGRDHCLSINQQPMRDRRGEGTKFDVAYGYHRRHIEIVGGGHCIHPIPKTEETKLIKYQQMVPELGDVVISALLVTFLSRAE
jgi:hypothetical protein